MRSFLLLLFCLGLTSPVSAGQAETYGSIHHAAYLRNRSADVITFNLPGLHPLIGREIEVKLRGLRLPAIAGRCEKESRLAEKARDVVGWLLANARAITLQDVGRDRSFRIAATVLADGQDIRQVLMAKGLASRAGAEDGPRDWCE